MFYKNNATVTCSGGTIVPKGFFCYTSVFVFADRVKRFKFLFCFLSFFSERLYFFPRCFSKTFQNLWTCQSHIKNRQWVHVKSWKALSLHIKRKLTRLTRKRIHKLSSLVVGTQWEFGSQICLKFISTFKLKINY